MKKSLSIIFSILFVISAISLSGLVVHAATYNGSCGENLTWEFDESTGTLTISGSGAMDDYYTDDSPWHDYCTVINKIALPVGLTSIGDYAFEDCTGLTEIIIHDNVISIGSSAFSGCTELTEITFPDSVTSIGSYAFSSCTGLTKVNITDLEAWCKIYFYNVYTNPLYYAKHLYLNGEEITKLEIPNSVIKMGPSAFVNCIGLTEVTIPDSITRIGEYAFRGCENLEIVNNYSGIYIKKGYSDHGYVGYYADTINWYGPIVGNCGDNLTWSFDTADYILIINGTGNMTDYTSSTTAPWYSYRSLIKEIVITEGVTSIGSSAFSGCTELTEISISNDVTSIGWGAFVNCTKLTEITIPNSITTIDNDVFYGCTGLTKVKVTSLEAWCKINFYNSCANPLYYAKHLYLNGEEITKLEIPNNIIEIGRSAFVNCIGLTEVTIPDSITSIGDYAFKDCTELTNVVMGNSVTSIGDYAFKDCTELTNVVMGNSVTSIGDYAFDCTELTEITIPDSITSIGEYAFRSCGNLKTVNNYSILPITKGSYGYGMVGYYTDTVNWYGPVVGNCGDNLTWSFDTVNYTLTISGTGEMYNYSYDKSPWHTCRLLIKEVVLPEGITGIGSDAFYDCTKLTEITIPDNVKTIGYDSFYGCENLKTVYNYSKLPIIKGSIDYGYVGYYAETVNWYGPIVGSCGDNLTWSFDTVNYILTISGTGDMYDYYYNPKPWYELSSIISEVVLPEGITNIGASAFSGCTELTEITIPEGVISIGRYAFGNCTNLTEIRIPRSVISIEYLAFDECENLKTVNNYSILPITKGSSAYGYVGYYADTVNWCGPIVGNCGENLTWSFDTVNYALTIDGTGGMDDYTSSTTPWDEFNSLIKSVVIGETVTSIGDYAFFDCENLKTVDNYSEIYILKGKTDYGYVGFYAETVNNCNAEPNGKCGENITWVLDAETGLLKIEGTGEMDFYNMNFYQEAYYSEPQWYGLRELITSVEISDGVTSIGNFADCINLNKISIPQSVTNISEYAFYNCTSLEEISIPGTIENIGNYAFGNCTNLSKVTLNEGLVRILQYAFYNCTSLKEINFPNSLWQIWYRAFGNCTGLEKITVGSNVSLIDSNAFYGCENLKTVYNYSNLPIIKGSSDYGCAGYYADTVNWYGKTTGSCGENVNYTLDGETGTLTIDGTGDMDNYSYNHYYTTAPWRNYCSLIKMVVINDSVTLIGNYSFYNCTELTSVTIGNSVTSIGDYAFEDCTGLTEITIPENIASIDDYAFYNCENLKTVNNFSGLYIQKGYRHYGYVSYYADTVNWYGKNIGSCGENIEYEFDAVTGVLKLFGSGKMTEYATYSEIPWYYYSDKITEIIVGDGIENIINYAFYGYDNLEKLTFGNTITTIDDFAFYSCDKLTELVIPDSVEYIGCYAFEYCTGLSKVTIYAENITIYTNVFYGCKNLKTVLNHSTLQLEKGYTANGNVAYYADVVINYRIPVQAKIITHNTVILEYPELTYNYDNYGFYEFKVNDGEWQLSAVFSNLLPNTTYNFYQRVKSLDENNTNPINVLQITTLKASNYVIPVSVEVKDVTVEWGSNVYSEYVNLEDGYYNIVPKEIIITYSDGSKYKYLYPNTYCLVRIISGLENCNDWNVGDEHILKGVYYCGGDGLPIYQLFYDINVTVAESNIEKIEYSDVKVIENFKNDKGYYDYYPQITVYYKNGTTEVYDFPNGITPEWYFNTIQGIGPLLQVGFFPIYSDTQNIEPWQVGESYKVTASFMGFTDEFTVTVIENPIKEIIVKSDILFIEDGEKTDVDGVYRFYPTFDLKFEMLLNDGEISTVEQISCGFAFWIYDSAHYAENWIEPLELEIGENTGSFSFAMFGIKWEADYCINLLSKKVSKPVYTEYTDTTVTLKNIDGYEYSKDGIHWQESNVFIGLNPNTEYYFYQRIKATEKHNVGDISDSLSITTFKSTPTKPSAPTVYIKTATTVTLNEISGYEYKLGDGEWQDSNVFSGLSPFTEYTFYQRIKETCTHYLSDSSDGLVEKTLCIHTGGTATCIQKAVCTICLQEYGEFDSTNHNHTEIRNISSQNCGNNGYVGDTYCTDCEAKLKIGDVIPATGKHIYNAGEITKYPTCKTNGVRTYTCTVCGHEVRYAIAKTTHTGLSWRKDNKGYKYCYSDGCAVTNTLARKGNNWCYAGADGYLVRNQFVWNGNNKCYVDGTGALVRNKLVRNGDSWSYVNEYGVMVRNQFVWNGNNKCYIDGTGLLARNRLVKNGNSWSYVNEYGVMVRNQFVMNGNNKCYIDGTGLLTRNKFVKNGNNWSYINEYGVMVKNKFVLNGKNWCYMNSNGVMVKNTKLYINNKLCTFNSYGILTSQK